MAEQRQELRANVEVEVNYRTLQEFIAAYSRNISGGGVFIRTPQPQPLNQEVLLRFTLPGIARRFEVRGVVVWSTRRAEARSRWGWASNSSRWTRRTRRCSPTL